MTPEEKNEFANQFLAFLKAMEEASERMRKEVEAAEKAFQVVESPNMRAVICKN